MMYIVKYKRRSDRNKSKWTEFSELLNSRDVYFTLRWLSRNSDNHRLISIELAEPNLTQPDTMEVMD